MENKLSIEPRVTVIIPNFNGHQFLECALKSVAQQKYADYKVEVWDDGSTDDSVALAQRLLESHQDWKLVTNSNVGIGANWNRAVEAVQTEYFCILHFDDEYEPDYLVEMVSLMDENSSAAIGHCPARTIDRRSQSTNSPLEAYKLAQFFPDDTGCVAAEQAFSALLKGNFINCPSVIFRTQAVRRVGLFDATLSHCLDWNYWFRVCLAEFSIAYTRKQLFRYRRHESNASRNNSKQLVRYQEEHRLLTDMRSQAEVTFKWEAGVPNLFPIFQGAVSDIEIDLLNGDPSDASSKLNYLSSIGAINGFSAFCLKTLIGCRKLGGYALSIALFTVVRSYIVAGFLVRKST